jgi:RHS repeat-associated protein
VSALRGRCAGITSRDSLSSKMRRRSAGASRLATGVRMTDSQPVRRRDCPRTTSVQICFPGQYRDAETGLHYNYFRDYDPQTGRYTSFDPVGQRGGINGYIYAYDDPLRFVDTKGLAPAPICPNPRECAEPPFDPSPSGPAPSPQPPRDPSSPWPNPSQPKFPRPRDPGDLEFCANREPTIETCVACCATQAFRRGPHWVSLCKTKCSDRWGITMASCRPEDSQ